MKIRAREEKFCKLNKGVSDKALIAYMQKTAQKLGRAPNKHEIVGFSLIKERFGPWHRALEKAGLRQPKKKIAN